MGFSFRKCRELVRGESSVGYSIEFFGYWSKQHKQKWLHSHVHQASINKSVSGFFNTLILVVWISTTKAEAAKIKQDMLHNSGGSRI